MAQLNRLIRDARRSMQARGHTPAPAKRSIGGGAAIIKCTHCKREAHVICKPQPNEIQIESEAVVLNCNVAIDKQFNHSVHDPNGQTGSIGQPEIRMDAVMGC